MFFPWPKPQRVKGHDFAEKCQATALWAGICSTSAVTLMVWVFISLPSLKHGPWKWVETQKRKGSSSDHPFSGAICYFRDSPWNQQAISSEKNSGGNQDFDPEVVFFQSPRQQWRPWYLIWSYFSFRGHDLSFGVQTCQSSGWTVQGCFKAKNWEFIRAWRNGNWHKWVCSFIFFWADNLNKVHQNGKSCSCEFFFGGVLDCFQHLALRGRAGSKQSHALVQAAGKSVDAIGTVTCCDFCYFYSIFTVAAIFWC